MAADPNAVEQAVSRTLRDNLEKIQRTADELHQAVNDMVSACASSRAGNALPSMLRAQTSAASLAATLEVLARFVTNALQPAMRMPYEPDILRVPSLGAPPAAAFEQPPPPPPHPIQEISWAAPAPAVPPPAAPELPPPVEAPAFSEVPPAVEMSTPAEPAPNLRPVFLDEPVPAAPHEPAPEFDLRLPAEAHPPEEPQPAGKPAEAAPVFNLDLLPPEEQELHRRAFRVAKVSMQDIKMLRPEQVRLGRENRDICVRLKDDIEKAHREYDRRFKPIMDHPVDYFYRWLVEILADGDPHALGEYPYATHARHN